MFLLEVYLLCYSERMPQNMIVTFQLFTRLYYLSHKVYGTFFIALLSMISLHRFETAARSFDFRIKCRIGSQAKICGVIHTWKIPFRLSPVSWTHKAMCSESTGREGIQICAGTYKSQIRFILSGSIHLLSLYNKYLLMQQEKEEI